MKKKYIIIIILLLVIIVLFYKRTAIRSWIFDSKKEPVPEAISLENFNLNLNSNINQNINSKPIIIENKNENINTPVIDPPQKPNNQNALPVTFNLNVPFTTQAPYFNWEMPYQEGCEEASLLTVHYYYEGKTFTEAITDQEILAMVAWQEENWGGHHDLTTEETAQMAELYWGYQNIELITNPTIEDIKEKIYQGYPVIVPAAGRLLENPYFTPPGPLYHMLVIKGWTENNFITNDPGLYTKGEDFQYSYENLINSIHDWNDGDVYNGQKIMLVLK